MIIYVNYRVIIMKTKSQGYTTIVYTVYNTKGIPKHHPRKLSQIAKEILTYGMNEIRIFMFCIITIIIISISLIFSNNLLNGGVVLIIKIMIH